MDNTARNTNINDESTFSIKDYLSSCLSHWLWFAISVVALMCIGYLYVMRQTPKYNRTMQLLIKNPEGASAFDVSSAFSQFGFGGGNTNVNNELISIQSPSLMYDVVDKLHLNVSLTKKGLLHGTSLYRSSAPFTLRKVNADEPGTISFRMDLQPDGSYTIYKLARSYNGENVKYKEEINGHISDKSLKTPAGSIYVEPNPEYQPLKPRDDEWTIYCSISSVASAQEYYSTRVTSDIVDPDAEVISLSIDDTNIQRATDILNTLVEVYQEEWLEDKNKVNVATSKFISDRLVSLQSELAEMDSEVSQFKSRTRTPDEPAIATKFLSESSSVSSELLKVNNQLAMCRYVRDYIMNPANRQSVIPINVGLPSSSIEKTISEYNEMVLARDNMMQNSGDNNPLVRDYDARIAGLRESIIRSLNSQVGTLESSLRTLERAQNASDSKLSALPIEANSLRAVGRDLQVKEALYLFLLQKMEETAIGQSYTVSNVRILTPPYGTSRPVSPRKSMTLMICFMLGLLFPAALIYVMVISNNTINSRRDIENIPVPYAGEIPHVGKKNTLKKYLKSKKQNQKEIDRPKPIVAAGKRDVPNEAFRVVRSNIDLMLGRNSTEKVIMITSMNPGSGKSFVAFNLGASFALKHKKVLVIDGDLRHGSMSTYVGSPRRGISSYLMGNTDDIMPLIRKADGFDELYVLPIGHRPPNPAELLETERFGKLLDILKPQFDLILVDCPPVNVVVDTQLLNRFADRTLFVVRAGLLKRSAVADIIDLYKDKKLRRMSVLLNGTEQAHSSYYTYGNYQSLED